MPTAPTAPAARARDGQRARVYRAEDAWSARLDAARRGAALAEVAGSSIVLPAERRFGSLLQAEAYAARVLALPEVVGAAGRVEPPAFRTRRGSRAAHWEPPGVVAVPVPRHGEPWALRESVLLHELAHHVASRSPLVAGGGAGHGPPYPAVLLLLVQAVLGEEAAFALRVEYGRERVALGGLAEGAGSAP